MSTRATVTGPNGETYEVEVQEDGSLSIWHPAGDTLVSIPESAGNVVRLMPWPNFQPIVPPTADRPVVVPRDLVQKVMSPRSNGVGSEAVAAVQAAVDAEPAIRSILEGIIQSTLTKRTSTQYGYETVVVREA